MVVTVTCHAWCALVISKVWLRHCRRLVWESTRVPDTPSSTESCEEETLGANTDAFTAEEEAIIQKRFEEGYDIQTDSRYNQWLKYAPPI